MLYRKMEALIEAHLTSDSQKILLIDGARQVGKTYLIRYVGQKLFENFIEINLVEDSLGDRLFAQRRRQSAGSRFGRGRGPGPVLQLVPDEGSQGIHKKHLLP